MVDSHERATCLMEAYWAYLSKTTLPFEPTAKSGSVSPLRSKDNRLIDMPKNFSPDLTSEPAILYENGNILVHHIDSCTDFIFNSSKQEAIHPGKSVKSMLLISSRSPVCKQDRILLCVRREICRCCLDHHSPKELQQPNPRDHLR